MNQIKCLIMDVDGTMTDGKIYIGKYGEEFKAFNVKDGFGINGLLPLNDIIPIVLTSRKSDIVVRRCDELNISHVIQDARDKEKILDDYLKNLKIDYSQAAYIGDDMPDYTVMKKCGIRGCPNDAVQNIKDISQFISVKNGGEGAVRDFIEWIIATYN